MCGRAGDGVEFRPGYGVVVLGREGSLGQGMVWLCWGGVGV